MNQQLGQACATFDALLEAVSHSFAKVSAPSLECRFDLFRLSYETFTGELRFHAFLKLSADEAQLSQLSPVESRPGIRVIQQSRAPGCLTAQVSFRSPEAMMEELQSWMRPKKASQEV